MLAHVQLDGAERALLVTEFEELVRLGRVGPETPVRIEALTGDRWVPARTLQLWQSAGTGPAAWLAQAWDRPSVPWVTALVCGLCIRAFVWTAGTQAGLDLSRAASRMSSAILERGESWRLVTYAFLHVSPGHILNNLVFLALVGVALETMVGWEAVAALFLLSAGVGGALAGWMSPGSPSVGASGGDYGFLAAAAVFGARFYDLLPARRRTVFGGTLAALGVWAFINGARSEGVDNWCHFGGLLAGLAFGAVVKPGVGEGRRFNRLLAAGVAVAALAGMGALRMAGPGLLPLAEEVADGVTVARPAWWEAGWAGNQESGWVSPTGRAVVAAGATRRVDPLTPEAAVEDYLATWRVVDAGVVVEATAPVTRDGVEGRRLQLGWREGDVAWRTDAEVYARGRYLVTIAVDTRPEDEALRSRLLGGALDAARLTTPKVVQETLDTAPSGPRGDTLRAQAASDLGDGDGAIAQLRALVARAPTDARVREVYVRELAAWKRPETVAEAEAALTALPTDRKLRVAVATALLDAGQADRARAVLEEGLAEAPGDVTLTRAKARLFPE